RDALLAERFGERVRLRALGGFDEQALLEELALLVLVGALPQVDRPPPQAPVRRERGEQLGGLLRSRQLVRARLELGAGDRERVPARRPSGGVAQRVGWRFAPDALDRAPRLVAAAEPEQDPRADPCAIVAEHVAGRPRRLYRR